MYAPQHMSSDRLIGVRAFFTCNSGYFRELVPRSVCKYYENEAKWKGRKPVCETRKFLTFCIVACSQL